MGRVSLMLCDTTAKTRAKASSPQGAARDLTTAITTNPRTSPPHPPPSLSLSPAAPREDCFPSFHRFVHTYSKVMIGFRDFPENKIPVWESLRVFPKKKE